MTVPLSPATAARCVPAARIAVRASSSGVSISTRMTGCSALFGSASVRSATPRASLTWKYPSSPSSGPVTGSREKPEETAARSSPRGVMPRSTVTVRFSGTITSPTGRVPSSSASRSRSPSAGASSPASLESFTSRTSSWSVNTEATSSFGSTLSSRSRVLAKALMPKMTGRSARVRATREGPSASAVATGAASAMFFGIISPMSMCRYVARVSAITKAIGWTRASGTPTASNGGSSRCAMAGSATAPSTSDEMVMPSWAVAMAADRCSRPQRVLLARRLPWTACGSIWLRRTEMRANSAPTKNALVRRVSRPMASWTVVIGRPPPRGRAPGRAR